MVLHPLTDAEQIRAAHEQLRAQLWAGAEVVRRNVGFQGYASDFDLAWRPNEGFWSLLLDRPPDESERSERYWCCFGSTIEPAHSLNIACEINMPREGVNRHCAGAFLRDESGRIYLGHSGKIGGGRKGIGKAAFLEHRGSKNIVDVAWPNRGIGAMILIGEIGNAALLRRLGDFVCEVETFKSTAVGRSWTSGSEDSEEERGNRLESAEMLLHEARTLPYPIGFGAGLSLDRNCPLSEDARRLLRALVLNSRPFGEGPPPAAPLQGREEANALVVYCFRDTHLEQIHRGLKLTNDEMKTLMLEAATKVRAWLELRDFFFRTDWKAYQMLVQMYGVRRAGKWDV